MSLSRKHPSDGAHHEVSFLVDTEEMHHRIAKLAYLKAAARGFEPGKELDDWLEAERQASMVADTEFEDEISFKVA
jgi:hypothetical protein